MKKEREGKRKKSRREKGLFKASPSPTTYTTKEEGLEHGEGRGVR